MSHLLLMQGLPGSGKTTRALELLVRYGNAVRLNRDTLRQMLHGGAWTGKKEAITVETMRAMAGSLLTNSDVGVVIIDDTNLNPRVVAQWQGAAHDFGVTFGIERMSTPLAECIARDAQRTGTARVGRSVIVGMAMQYGLYPKPAEGFIICDIDGTLADCTHRLHYAQQDPKDWQGFFDAMGDDTPRQEVIDRVVGYQKKGYEIILVSGRPESHREQTGCWLLRCAPGVRYEALFMRRAGDHRPDTMVKEEILTRYFPDLSWIEVVVDDRPSVLRMWQSHGLRTIDVGNQQEF